MDTEDARIKVFDIVVVGKFFKFTFGVELRMEISAD